MINKETFLSAPDKLLYKKPFTRGANEDYIRIYKQDVFDDSNLIAEIPAFTGRTISQAQYLLELDPNSHAIMFNDDLPRLSSNPNASWDEANPYRASFSFQSQILAQHSEYMNAKGMKFTLLNTNPTDEVHSTFVEIKDEWVTRQMDVVKAELYEEQKSVGDAAVLFYFNASKKLKTRLLSYRNGYQLIPQYDSYGEMILFTVYYKSEKVEMLDVYDESNIYYYAKSDSGYVLYKTAKHGFDEIPIVYKRGEVAWEKGQVLIDIYELLYNIYMIVEKKVGFPLLYIIGKPQLERKNDTAVILKDSTTADMKSDAKFLNPEEPKGFQNLLNDLFKKIQIFTSSILLSADEIKITSDISGVAMKMLRSSIYEKAQKDIREYDLVADKLLYLFKAGVSMELGKFSKWNLCKVRAQYDLWIPQSDTETSNRLITQKQAGIISAQTATELSPDSQPDELSRIAAETATIQAKLTEEENNNNPTI